MIEPAALIDQARTWLGVPFRHQGRSRVGVDCAGFIVALLKEVKALPKNYREPRQYGRLPSRELREVVLRYCAATENPEPACLVLIKWPQHEDPSHVALLTGETLIHCYQRAGRVVEHGYRGAWIRDTVGYYRLPGVRYGRPV
jgi:cell wall-associated NlpC family hydrolase